MTTFILEEHHTQGKTILAQKVIGNEPQRTPGSPTG